MVVFHGPWHEEPHYDAELFGDVAIRRTVGHYWYFWARWDGQRVSRQRRTRWELVGRYDDLHRN